MVPHLVQLGTADFSDKWAVLFSEAPKELPDRSVNILHSYHNWAFEIIKMNNWIFQWDFLKPIISILRKKLTNTLKYDI